MLTHSVTTRASRWHSTGRAGSAMMRNSSIYTAPLKCNRTLMAAGAGGSHRDLHSNCQLTEHKTAHAPHENPLQRCFIGALAMLQAVAMQLSAPLGADAVLNSPNAQIARSVDAALRRSIPAFNPEVSKLQSSLEDIQYLLRIPQRKPWGSMAADISAALSLFDNKEVLKNGVPEAQADQGAALVDTLYSRLKQLELAVKTQQPDAVSIRVANALETVAQLELLQAPGLTFNIPKEYATLPRLVGRAVVRLEVEKADGANSFVDAENGGLMQRAVVEITLDGYSAPISAGNFLVNVMDGIYNGKSVQSSYASVIVSGEATAPRAPIPLEILPKGQFDPIYRSPLDVQYGELPVLPLSISGAVSMTHLPDVGEGYLSGDEWFIYKFDKQQAGLAGLAFDEGTFGTFGYITKGMDIITSLQTGDVIVGMKVVSGADKLIRPKL